MRWIPLMALLGCGSPQSTTQATEAATSSGTSPGPATGTPTGAATGTTPATSPCALQTFDAGLTPTTEIHVDPGGDDTTGDGSAGSPYGSIERAADDAMPGSAIVVHAGTYPGGDFLYDLRGTETAPIWVGGAMGEARPLISGGSEALHLIRPAWVVLHDLEATGATSNGINIDDGGDYDVTDAAHHVVVRNVSIHDVGTGGNQDCLKLSGLRHHTVIDSDFARCGGGGSGSGVDHVGCHDGLIANNQFTDLSASGIQSKGGTSNIEIRGNWFEAAGDRSLNLGGSTGFSFFRPALDPYGPNAEARDLTVVANVFVGSEAPLAFVGCTGCVARHNTLIDPGKWFARILQETTSTTGFAFDAAADGVLENNLVLFTRANVGTEINVGSNTDADSFTWQNNLFYASDDPGNSTPTLPGTVSGSIVGMDPLLDASHRPTTGSPALGAGVSTPVLCDREGRPYASPPTIGAYAAP